MNGSLTKLSEVEYTEVNCQDWDGKTDWTAKKGPAKQDRTAIYKNRVLDPDPQ